MITRTLEIADLTPKEVAKEFADMFGDEQAAFFDHVWQIAKDWPGAGWCMQSCAIAQDISEEGREAVRVLASHVLNRDDL